MRSDYDDEMMRDEHMRCELARLDRIGAFCDERARLEWLAERGDVCAERRLDEIELAAGVGDEPEGAGPIPWGM